MSECADDLCATCGHRRGNHRKDRGCTMFHLLSQQPCPCEAFLDARDLNFNLQEEARDERSSVPGEGL